MTPNRSLAIRLTLALCALAPLAPAGEPLDEVYQAFAQRDLRTAERALPRVIGQTYKRSMGHGLVSLLRGEFSAAEQHLARANRNYDNPAIRETYAISLALNGRFEQARDALGRTQGKVVQLAIAGPFRARYPLAAEVLEQRSPSGRFRVVSDLCLPTPLASMEAELQRAAPNERPALLARFKAAHRAPRELGALLDRVHARFGALLTDLPLQGEEGVMTVYVFAQQAQFETFAGALGNGDSSTGAYYPVVRTLACTDARNEARLEGGALRLGLDLLEVLIHESFHLYLHRVCPQQPPIWLNEGLADYFMIRVSRELLGQGQPTPYPAKLLDVMLLLEGNPALAPALPLPQLLSLERGAFYAGGKRQATHYAQSWILVHALISSTSGRQRLFDYVRAFRDGGSAASLNASLLGSDPARGAERVWRKHAARAHAHFLELDPSAARRLEQAGVSAVAAR